MNLDYKCYGEVVNQLQETLYWLVREDSNIASYVQVGENKFNIYDGNPTSQSQIGFPFIIIHTPTIAEERLTFSKTTVTLLTKIEIVDKKERNVRELADAVRAALVNKNERTRVKGFTNERIMNSTLSSRFLPNESSKAVWVYILFVRHYWRGFKND